MASQLEERLLAEACHSRYDAHMSDMIVIFGGLILGEALAQADPNAGFNCDLLLILNLLVLAVSLLTQYILKHSE